MTKIECALIKCESLRLRHYTWPFINTIIALPWLISRLQSVNNMSTFSSFISIPSFSLMVMSLFLVFYYVVAPVLIRTPWLSSVQTAVSRLFRLITFGDHLGHLTLKMALDKKPLPLVMLSSPDLLPVYHRLRWSISASYVMAAPGRWTSDLTC